MHQSGQLSERRWPAGKLVSRERCCVQQPGNELSLHNSAARWSGGWGYMTKLLKKKNAKVFYLS